MTAEKELQKLLKRARNPGERERIRKMIKYYGITLRWRPEEIVTKIRERTADSPEIT